MSSRQALKIGLIGLVGLILLGCRLVWSRTQAWEPPLPQKPTASATPTAVVFQQTTGVRQALEALAVLLAELPPQPPPALQAPTVSLTPTASPAVQPVTLTPTATPDPTGCIPAGAALEYGIVLQVLDGDSLLVDIQGVAWRVGYLGLDAPEYYPSSEYFGPPARARNAALVLKRVVRLVADGGVLDAHSQMLRYVLVGDIFVNYALLRDGLARVSSFQGPFACAATFLEAEQIAKQEQLGLWKSPELVWGTPGFAPTLTRSAGVSDTPTPTSTGWVPCSCTGDLYNCPDFASQLQAQACLDYCLALGRGDIHRLDSDQDGLACEK